MRDIESVKKQLEQRLRELGAKVEEIEDDLRTPRSASWEDRATEIEGDEVLGALEGSAVGEIDDIRAALKRIEDGTYGVCSRCGEDIDERRLQALPYATECIQCARSGST
jgi:DnaK suppressor protein